jgi:hypothetical protein
MSHVVNDRQAAPGPVTPGVKLLKGNNTYFVRPDGQDYGPCVDFIRSHPGESLTLWLERSLPLAPLMKMDGISEVREITCWRKDEDVHLLESLTQLEGINLAEAQAFAFSQLRRLSWAGGVWSSKWSGLAACTELERFHVSAYKRPDLRELGAHRHLKAITLITTSVASMDGVSDLPDLDYVEVYRGSALKGLTGLNGASSLKQLRIEGCRKLSDYDAIADLPALEGLALDKCGPIPSLSFISRFPALKFIGLSGTELIDKDLLPCLAHPNLRWLDVSGRGYSPSSTEVKQALEARANSTHN